VHALAEVLDRFPPILVHAESMIVIDGHHRLEASRRSGRDHVRAILASTTLAEAAALAIAANVAHGLPLTLTERKGAAGRVLRAKPAQSDRSVAILCGLAPSTVAKVRVELLGAKGETMSRIGVDGHRHARCADDVKERLAEALRDHPEQSFRSVAREVGSRRRPCPEKPAAGLPGPAEVRARSHELRTPVGRPSS
jgi:ParB-like chromosome segregation protein Spo0J